MGAVTRRSKSPKRAYHTNVAEARADGWLKPYEGGHVEGAWDARGKIYGYLPGNHRLYRCFKRN